MLDVSFCKQIDVLSAVETTALRNFLEKQPDDNFFYESRYHRRGLVKDLPADYRFVIHWDSWFKVEFDSEAKIASERVTEVYQGYEGYDRVLGIFHKAMEVMATHLCWNSSTQFMGITIMQHFNLKRGQQVGPIEWHRDSGSHALVVLIDSKKGWDGGEFLFKRDEESLQTYTPCEGKGMLFSNEGTHHYVAPIVAKDDQVNRTIFTIHRSGKDKEK